MKHKTRTERVYNEATGWYETREVELKGYTFTDDDRILIVREYLESGVPAEKIWHQTVSLLREDGSGASLSTLCGLFGYSRQAYNK